MLPVSDRPQPQRPPLRRRCRRFRRRMRASLALVWHDGVSLCSLRLALSRSRAQYQCSVHTTTTTFLPSSNLIERHSIDPFARSLPQAHTHLPHTHTLTSLVLTLPPRHPFISHPSTHLISFIRRTVLHNRTIALALAKTPRSLVVLHTSQRPWSRPTPSRESCQLCGHCYPLERPVSRARPARLIPRRQECCLPCAPFCPRAPQAPLLARNVVVSC